MQEDSNKKYDGKPNYIKTIVLDVLFLAFCAFCMFYRFPYYIYTTGGSINLNERITSESNYKMDGSYSMNYVTVVKGNLPAILFSFVRSDWDLVREEEVTYSNMDYEQTLKIEKMQLQNSLDAAKVIAFEKAGKQVRVKEIKTLVAYIDENAQTDLEILDEIKAVDNVPYESLDDLKAYINSFEKGHEFTFKVIDADGKEKTRTAKSYRLEDNLLVGISVIDNYEYETDEEISVATKASEAGPSGGLLLTLAMYDTLIEDDLTKGRKIMGTGTIEADGSVGEIGGVKYKMLGAQKDGADIFFVPEGNYKEAKEVYKKYDLDFDLVMVRDIDEAIKYLEK